MEIPGAGRRLTSSICLAPVVGLILASLGSVFIPDLSGTFSLETLQLFVGILFLLGLGLTALLHNFYHRTRVIYIILLCLGIPAALLGGGICLWSLMTFSEFQKADLPGERGVHAALGGVMMMAGIVFGLVIFATGLLSIISAVLGFSAFKARLQGMTPPSLDPSL
mgnify:CR=1 FL=1